MEERGGQRGGILPEVCEEEGCVEGVLDVGFAGFAELALMLEAANS